MIYFFSVNIKFLNILLALDIVLAHVIKFLVLTFQF